MSQSPKNADKCGKCCAVFSDVKALNAAVRCLICRKPFHDGCLGSVSAGAAKECRLKSSNVCFVCVSPACRAAQADSRPLYSEKELDECCEKDAKILFEKYKEERQHDLEKLNTEYTNLKSNFEALRAASEASNNDERIAVLNKQLAQAKTD